jgi:diguanylate cyclase (GGDEF)-like protein
MNDFYAALSNILKMLNELQDLAYRDDVTHLFNQRKLNLDLDESIKLYENKGIGFSLLFIDIDHFKTVNDGHGHLIGSKLLVEVAKEINSVVRDEDQVYRYGGDEFVVLLPQVDGALAYSIAERILDKIKMKKFMIEDFEKRLSVSIGVSDYPYSAASKDEIIQLADDMMYLAKKSGRGQVCFAKEIVACTA